MKENYSRNLAKQVLLILIVLINTTRLMAQVGTPSYYNSFAGTTGNSFPLASATNKVQYIYGPNLFYTGGTGTGSPVGAGNNITKVYFKLSGYSGTTAYTNFTISLGQNVGTATTIPSTTFNTGLTQCFFQASGYQLVGGAASNWYGITLQTPFAYDPSLSLVFEMKASNTGATNTVANVTTTGVNQRLYAAYAATTGTSNTGLLNFGIDVVSGSGCTNPPTAGTSTAVPSSGICSGTNVTLNLTGNSVGAGQTYQWESCPTIAGTYTNVGSSSAISNLIIAASTTLYYRCKVTCVATTTSTPVLVSVNPAFPGGTYTINSAVATGGGNYQTFAAAVAALSCGIAGPVVFNVNASSGPYNEQIDIPSIGGSSAINTVTFNGNGRTLSFDATSSTYYGTLNLSGADYFIFNDLNMVALGVANAWGIHFMSASDNNVFNNCSSTVSITSTSTATQSVVMNASNTVYSTGGSGGNNNTFTNCTFVGGYYGVVLYGASGAGNTGNIFTGCNFRESYTYSSYHLYSTNGIIRNSIMERPTRTNPSTGCGTYLTTGCANMLIEKNRVRNMFGGLLTSTGTCYGFACIIAASAGNENKFYNNVISDLNFNGAAYGLYFSGGTYVNAYHNTISLDHTAASGTTTTYGMYSTGTTAVDLRNNIVTITRGGTGAKHCVYYTSPAGVTSNYNDLYINAAAGTNNLGYNGTSYSTLALWQASSGKDANSVSVNPIYVNPGSNDYTPQAGLINNIGTGLGITTDIMGNPRSVSTPDPGAYEYDLGGLDAAISWVSPSSPTNMGLKTITVNIANTQAQIITDLSLSYNDGGTPVTENFSGLNILSGANQNFSFAVQYNLTGNAVINVDILSVNLGADAVSSNNTASYSLCIALAGTYTINSALATGGTNFQTFTAAAAAMACGITAPVIFNVDAASGPYSEQVTFPAISGASAINTITINGNGRTLTFATAGDYYTLRLNGADYMSWNNLNIVSTGATNAIALTMMNASDNNNFTNCTFSVPLTLTATPTSCVAFSSSTVTATGTGNNGNNNIFTGCTMNGGYYCVSVYGLSGGNVLNNQFINCTMQEYYVYGIYHLYGTGTIIRGCTFQRPSRATVSTGYGIYMTTGTLNCLVEKNRVRNLFGGAPTSTSASYALGCVVAASAGNENKFYNNVISSIGGDGINYGLYFSGGNYIKAYHNTVAYNSTTSAATGATYAVYSSGANNDIRNNIVYVTRGGTGTKYCLYYPTVPAISNYNVLFMNAAAGTNYIGYNGSTFATLALWQGTGSDLNSISADPVFFNPTLNNYKPTSVNVDNFGINGLGVADDILGITRSISTPDQGAYEFSVSPFDVGAFALVTPGTGGCYTSTESVQVTIKNLGSALLDFSVNPVTVTCDVTGQITASLSTLLSTGTLATGATMNVTLAPTLDMTANGTYLLDIYTSMTADGNPTNDALATETRTVAIVAGTVSATQTSLCVSGTPILTVAGSSGGAKQWQVSTVSATGPWTNVGSGGASYTPASPVTQTSYYQVEVSCNAGSSPSNVITVNVNSPSIVSTTPGSANCSGAVSLSAVGSSGTSINWYTAVSGGTPIFTGPTYTTPVISTTTNYYAAASSGGFSANMGLANRVGATANTGYTDIGLMFDAYQPFTLQSVAMYPVGTGGSATITIAVKNSAGTILQSTVATVTTVALPSVKTVIPLNFLIPAGTQHRLVVTAATGLTGLIREVTTGYAYPYTLASVASITSAYTSGASSAYYYYFYDWAVSTGCESPRSTVVATIVPAPSISVTSASPVVCTGGSTTVSVSSAIDPNYTYTWSSVPAGFSATGPGPHTIAPTQNTVYNVSASDNTAGPNAGCTNSGSVSISAGTLAAGTVSSSQYTYCTAGTPTLTVAGASGGTIQWQQSTVSASGGFVNVGTNSATYIPSSAPAVTTHYRIQVTCGVTTLTSNTVTVVVNSPLILTTTPATRCGIGAVTVSATSSPGSLLFWYSAATGGTFLTTGTSYSTNVTGSTNFYVEANDGSGSGGTAIVVSELDLGTNDRLEITNVSPIAVDLTGWRVAVSNSYTVFNTVNANVQLLSGNLAAGATLSWTDLATGPNYWGSNILWNPGAGPTYTGWAIIIDNTGAIVDFVATNWPSATIAAGSLVVGPYTVSPGTKWSGNGIDQTNVAATQSVSRQGSSDNNNLSDFAIINLSMDALNPGMANPFTGFGCSSPRMAVTATVNAAPIVNTSALPSSLCGGQSSTLSASSTNAGYTYNWTPGNLPGASVSVSPSTTTTYTVNAVDNTAGPNAGCAAIATVAVTVDPSSAVSVTPTSTVNFPGDMTVLNATAGAFTVGAGGTTLGVVGVAGGLSPFSQYYESQRTQYLLLASDLSAAGLTPGNINSAAVNITNALSTLPFTGYTIKMGATATTTLTALLAPTFTTVFGPATLPPITSNGFATLPFTTSFVWNGTSNIVIDICYDNDPGNLGTFIPIILLCKQPLRVTQLYMVIMQIMLPYAEQLPALWYRVLHYLL